MGEDFALNALNWALSQVQDLSWSLAKSVSLVCSLVSPSVKDASVRRWSHDLFLTLKFYDYYTLSAYLHKDWRGFSVNRILPLHLRLIASSFVISSYKFLYCTFKQIWQLYKRIRKLNTICIWYVSFNVYFYDYLMCVCITGILLYTELCAHLFSPQNFILWAVSHPVKKSFKK